MTDTMKWSSVEVELENREDGSRIIRNKVPLASCPDNLCTWLHRNADENPEKQTPGQCLQKKLRIFEMGVLVYCLSQEK